MVTLSENLLHFKLKYAFERIILLHSTFKLVHMQLFPSANAIYFVYSKQTMYDLIDTFNGAAHIHVCAQKK